MIRPPLAVVGALHAQVQADLEQGRQHGAGAVVMVLVLGSTSPRTRHGRRQGVVDSRACAGCGWHPVASRSLDKSRTPRHPPRLPRLRGLCAGSRLQATASTGRGLQQEHGDSRAGAGCGWQPVTGHCLDKSRTPARAPGLPRWRGQAAGNWSLASARPAGASSSSHLCRWAFKTPSYHSQHGCRFKTTRCPPASPYQGHGSEHQHEPTRAVVRRQSS